MSEELKNETTEQPTIPALSEGNPQSEDVTVFPQASDAKHKAAKQFRKGVLQMLSQAIEGGINKTIIEVSHVSDALVGEVKTELEDLGYVVYFRNVAKTSEGYTSRNIVVSYEWNK